MSGGNDRVIYDWAAAKHPSYYEEIGKRADFVIGSEFLCQCKSGCLFDYRERALYPVDDKAHAPCQGKCPKCGSPIFSLYHDGKCRIKFNFDEP